MLAEEIDLENIDSNEPEFQQLIQPNHNDSAADDKLEHLSVPELEIKHKSFPLDRSSLEPTPILNNRPDLSEYDDEEDVPF